LSLASNMTLAANSVVGVEAIEVADGVSANLGNLAVKKRLPAVSMFVEFAEAGGFLAYGPSLRESFRRAGGFAGRILEGAKPADMPVERPTTFELVINRTTANALGLTLPAPLVRRAHRVIE